MTVPNETLEQHRQENPRRYEPAAVYRLWDTDGNLLYIGSAYDPEERCKAHRSKPWWPSVVRRTEEWHSTRGEAYAEEMKAIAVEGAKYNQMGAPGYTTPQTDAVKQRNALAKTRGKLISEGYSVKNDIREAAREAGYSPREIERLTTLAEIEFLEWTGLFARSVKWRREQIERYGH